MVRSIPPRTMSKGPKERSKPLRSDGLDFKISLFSRSNKHFSKKVSDSYKGKVYNKPRQWQYITKPFFKRLKAPIVDVFKEAEEVQIIIDLGNFRKGELNFGLNNQNYILSGKHEDYEFKEEIFLPYDVDIKKIKEIFRNDILEITLPKKRTERKRRKKDEK